MHFCAQQKKKTWRHRQDTFYQIGLHCSAVVTSTEACWHQSRQSQTQREKPKNNQASPFGLKVALFSSAVLRRTAFVLLVFVLAANGNEGGQIQ